MNKTFREVFEEEREVGTGVASHWGYSLRSTGLDARLRKANGGKVPVVANINTLRLTKDIPKTSRILQIEEELRGIENGRLLAKFTEEAARTGGEGVGEGEGGKSAIMQLMEEKVREYNHIVLHKHLDKHYNEETRRILKIDRDAGEELIEQMGEGQQRRREGNLSAQIRLNKYMAQLYKSYRSHLDHQRPLHPSQSSNAKTIVSEPAKSARNATKHEEIPKLDRIRHFGRQHSDRKAGKTRSDKALLINVHNVQDSMRGTQARVSSQHGHSPYLSASEDPPACLTDRTSSKRIGSRQQQERILRTIGSPFMEREKLDEYRRIEKSSNNNYATLGMFRSKISDYMGKITITDNKPKYTNSKPKNTSLLTENPRTLHSFSTHAHAPPHEEVVMSEEERRVYNSILSDNREKYSEQKVILGELLKKKRNKYNKVGLSRVMVKYNQEEEAKWLLKGVPHTHPHSPPPHQQTQLSDGLEECDPAEEDEHYQRMCKNEKINLLLKHR